MRLWNSVFCVLLLAIAALGQDSRGSISGTVLDPAGSPAKNVSIQAKNTMTGAIAKAVTSAIGKYSFQDLPSGTYDLTASVAGLKAYEAKRISVQAGKISQLDIHLEEGTQLSTLGEDPQSIAADLKRHAPPSGPTPRTSDGKPDLSGVWWSPRTVDPGQPEFLPWAIATAKERVENNRKDSPQARCLPSAVLRVGPLFQLVQSKDFLVMISDDDSPGFHQVYLDGRGHPKEPDPGWYGHSIGKWEGDTLVVDRVDFIDQVYLDLEAHPHSDRLHVIERYRRPDLGHLEIDITVDDPGTLSKSWTMKRVADAAPKEEIREFICNENNQDVEHLVGKAKE